ncbi:MAG TPA: histidine triad nucleotide-binding protein [Peptococcaceae bacterium]|nr:MAG: Histidine triad (HIT) protein [Clostridia bacterium 41_269]HBT20311.1 histidine triad nucleotide-binding protein [Peptococcaceae bacterium]
MAEKDCVFCKIVAGELPSEIVYENDDILAFKDINPVAPIHILLIPKKHIPTITDITEEDTTLMGKLLLAAGKVAEKLGIYERGFRLVNNCREEGGQVIYHLHFHLLGGRKFGSVG